MVFFSTNLLLSISVVVITVLMIDGLNFALKDEAFHGINGGHGLTKSSRPELVAVSSSRPG